MKRIPRQLKHSILNNLIRSGPLTSSQLAERIQGDQTVPAVYQKNPRQMAYILKRMCREDDRMKMIEIGRNGKLPNGTDRFRIAFAVDEQLTLEEVEDEKAESVKEKMKQITVNLPADCVEYLTQWKDDSNLSPGRVFELLIRADIEANGQPNSGSDTSEQ